MIDLKKQLEMGMQGRWNKMEECFGVNERQLFVQVDCNLEE